MISGVERWVGSGTPRLPRKLVPQQATSLDLQRAQLCDHPADTLATPSRHAASRPAMATGGEIRGDAAWAVGLGACFEPQPTTIPAIGAIAQSLNGCIEGR